MALSKENGNERVRQIIQPPKIIKPFVPITIAPPVKFSPKTIFTKTEGSTRDSPESEFKGTYGKGKIEGAGSLWKTSATKRISFGPGNGRSAYDVSPGDDAAKKLARIAAIKKARLNNKKSNVGTSTTADAAASPALSSLLTGGGGYGSGYLAESAGNGGFSFSDIPSIVWIILAVGAGYWLIKSGGKGKLF